MRFGALRKRRVFLLVILLLSVSAVAGASWWYWQTRETVLPPTIDDTGADPDVAAAIEVARRAVIESPRSSSAWGRLGQILAAHSYDAEAAVCFMQAEMRDPKEARWPYLQGLTQQFSDTDAAIVKFQTAVQLRPDEAPMRLRLAEVLLSQGRSNEAEEQYHQLLELDPSNPRGHLGLGRLAMQRGDLRTSRAYLGRSIDSALTQKAAHTLLAEVEQRSNDPIAAARERHRADELAVDQDWFDPIVAEVEQLRAGRQARLDRALKRIQIEGLEQGIASLRELTRAYPHWDQVWLMYGRAQMERGKLADAVESLRYALSLAPNSVETHYYLGHTFRQMGNHVAAAASFRQASKLKPDYAMAYYNLGQCLIRTKDLPEAEKAFREVVRCKPNHAAAHAKLGELLADRGDNVEAITHLRLAVELNPDDTTSKARLEPLEPPTKK